MLDESIVKVDGGRLDIFQTNPYTLYRWLHLNDPVHWQVANKGRGAWYVTRYKDVLRILKDPRFAKRIATPEAPRISEDFANIQKNMVLFMNPPKQMLIRTNINKALTPLFKEDLRQRIQEVTNQLLDHVHNAENIELIGEYAFPLSIMIIAEILGVPTANREQFCDWTCNLIRSIDFSRNHIDLNGGEKAAADFIEYFQMLIKQRRKNPQNDLISALISTEIEGIRLSEDELLATCILILIAGHETTASLIGNGILTLLHNPEQLCQMKENPSLISHAVEEILRYESPTQVTVRFATEDVQVHGKVIKKGQQVNLLLGAANRDPEQFIQPDRFDITRNPNPHLAFGTGTHLCLGAWLARAESQVAIGTLFHRIPNLHLQTEKVEWKELVCFRSLKSLHASF